MSWFLALCNVTFVNVILSADNALAISIAASKLPGSIRKKAILWGSLIGVLLRIVFLVIGSYLIKLPILKSAAGLMLLWIAIHLAVDHVRQSTSEQAAASSDHSKQLWKAIRTITMTDLIMSLDNAVAMLGVANGRIGILMVSLVISIPFLMFGSHFVAGVIQKFSWIIYVAATYIAWLAGSMIAEDPIFERISWATLLQWIAPVSCLIVFGAVLSLSVLAHRHRLTSAQRL